MATQVRIRGVETDLFLAMDSRGMLVIIKSLKIISCQNFPQMSSDSYPIKALSFVFHLPNELINTLSVKDGVVLQNKPILRDGKTVVMNEK